MLQFWERKVASTAKTVRTTTKYHQDYFLLRTEGKAVTVVLRAQIKILHEGQR